MQTSKDTLACINRFMHLIFEERWSGEKFRGHRYSKCRQYYNTLPGVDVTDMTYQPSSSLSNRFNSNETSYVNPSESLTVVKSLQKNRILKSIQWRNFDVQNNQTRSSIPPYPYNGCYMTTQASDKLPAFSYINNRFHMPHNKENKWQVNIIYKHLYRFSLNHGKCYLEFIISANRPIVTPKKSGWLLSLLRALFSAPFSLGELSSECTCASAKY